MADKLQSIKLERTSFGRVDTSVTACDLQTVKVKLENEVLLGAEAGTTNDTGIVWKEVKVEKIDSAPDNVTTSCGQSVTTNVSVKEEGAPICFDLVKKIKVEKGLLSEGEDEIKKTGIGMMEVKDEEDNASSDLTSASESTSRFTSNGQFVDTSALTKEEDLGVCFEEEKGSPQVDFDCCASFRDKENSTSGDKGSPKSVINQGTDEFSDICCDPREPTVSSIVDSGHVIGECEKSDSLQGDPSVVPCEKPFQCIDCTARFKTKWHLKQHAAIHSNEKPFACSQCASTFKLKSALNRHLTTHSDERPFHCSHCTSNFKTKMALKAHSHVHSSEKPFICTQCPARFTQKGKLKMHSAVHSSEKPFICTQCPARFTRKGELKQHSAVHSSEKPFICTQCPTRFTRMQTLKKHLAVHSNERPFACPYCSSTFKRKTNLNSHLICHADTSSFSCAICTSSFKIKHHLKRHLLIHSSEKPFICMHCPARFTRKSNLKVHLAAHSNEKPLGCAFCSARFSQKNSLKKHLAIHSNRRPF